MSITQTASRVRIESAAKNGTLGTQGAINANQIKFDTAITVNNGNLMASPTFDQRHVILRRGDGGEEWGVVQTVDVDGVTCTMADDWDVAPASGDAYDVAYGLDDLVTIAGCSFETGSRQHVMTKRLVIGITTTTFGFLGMGFGQVLRLDDSGPSTSAFLINTLGHFELGHQKNDNHRAGGVLIFDNDASSETVWEIDGTARVYDFLLLAARRWDGVKDLLVTVDVGATVKHAAGNLIGVDAPFKKRRKRFKRHDGGFLGTVTAMKNSTWHGGHLLSENDQLIKDEIAAEANGASVRLIIEDA